MHIACIYVCTYDVAVVGGEVQVWGLEGRVDETLRECAEARHTAAENPTAEGQELIEADQQELGDCNHEDLRHEAC